MITLFGFIILYGILALVDIGLMAKHVKKGFDGIEATIKEESEVLITW
jgi:cytochrome bd-type quinol oxidase subunit 1